MQKISNQQFQMYTKNKKFILLTSILIFVLASILIKQKFNQKKYSNNLPRIAHAGGGFRDLTYTNSIDALNYNLNYYDFFEIDLAQTSDGKIVCIHDWEISVKKTFGENFQTTPPTYKEFFTKVKSNKKFENCSLESLVVWLMNNPGKTIITDVKGNNISTLSYIANIYPHLLHRFIPQIYYPQEYAVLKKIGYKKIIWTLYRYKGDTASVINSAKQMSLFAITMPESQALQGLGRVILRETGIKSYVHTINKQEDLEKYKELGINEIYTDWLHLDLQTK